MCSTCNGAAAADARRVDELEGLAVRQRNVSVDGISGRTAHVADDAALLACTIGHQINSCITMKHTSSERGAS